MHPKYTQLSLFDKPIRVSRVMCICTICGATFYVTPSAIRAGRGKTCSRECQYKSVSAKALARRYPEHISPRVSLTCPVCGKGFDMTRAEYEWRSTHDNVPTYCSRRCSHDSPEWKRNLGESLRNSERLKASRRTSVPKMTEKVRSPEGRERLRRQTLAQMNDPEKRKAWEEGIRRRTESPEWRSAKHFQRGAAHPRYTGGRRERQTAQSRYEYKTWRKQVFHRDDYTCQQCNSRGTYLHAHHIKPWATHPALRYEVSNGITLCKECHIKLHKAERVIPE